MLPGSPNLVQGGQYDITATYMKLNSQNENEGLVVGPPPFNQYQRITNAIGLRNVSPSIYQNAIKKIDKTESNLLITVSKSTNVVIIERWYPRRNTFVSISNLSEEDVTMDLSELYYSGEIVLGRTKPERIYFEGFTIRPTETIIIKLDK